MTIHQQGQIDAIAIHYANFNKYREITEDECRFAVELIRKGLEYELTFEEDFKVNEIRQKFT